MKCKCHPDSPFHWRQNKRPSMFQADINFRAPKTGQTLSQASTAKVEQARAEGKMAGFVKGISRNREEEILRMRNFTTFTLAAVLKNATKRKDTDDQVPPVRGVD